MTISAIRAETWEAINRILLANARQETSKPARSCGSTARSPPRCCMSRATADLLSDAVRVMVRLVKVADTVIGGRLVWRIIGARRRSWRA